MVTMKRRERVNRDRGEMARKALVKAGYLTGEETEGEITAALIEEIAAGFIADVYHFADNLKLSVEPADRLSISGAAMDAYRDDIGRRF
jgi:hypothetical protein